MPNSDSLGRNYLNKDAVPSVFHFPAHLQKPCTRKRASPGKRSYAKYRLLSEENQKSLADNKHRILEKGLVPGIPRK